MRSSAGQESIAGAWRSMIALLFAMVALLVASPAVLAQGGQQDGGQGGGEKSAGGQQASPEQAGGQSSSSQQPSGESSSSEHASGESSSSEQASGGSSGHGSSGGSSSEGSFLVSPGLGLMLWTLLAFGATMFVLKRLAFPRIGEALEKRANAVRENIEASERQREEADKLLEEYRQRLTEAREQADDIVARSRKAAEAAVTEAAEEGKAKREELLAAARRDIESETRRSLEQIRKEIADLTVLATEKVTRSSLDSDDHKRLVEDALSEVDFSALAGSKESG